MNLKLCRTCGRSGKNFVNIFQIEGLKYKIETCLPITVFQHCLLPSTLCPECLLSIEQFYSFTKNCLESIIILESKLDIQESSLKSRRKKDFSCTVDLPKNTVSQQVQTQDYLDILLGDRQELLDYKSKFPFTTSILKSSTCQTGILVDYEIDSESNDDDLSSGCVVYGEKLQGINAINTIVETLLTRKRKSDNLDDDTAHTSNKLDSGHKRKCSQPKKLEQNVPDIKQELDYNEFDDQSNNTDSSPIGDDNDNFDVNDQPQCCLLCNAELANSLELAEHFMQTHRKDPAQTNVDSPLSERKRNIPRLVKISDLKPRCDDDSQTSNQPTQNSYVLPKVVCPNCLTTFETKPELFVHLQLSHSNVSTYLCGICLKQTDSETGLKQHIEKCVKTYPLTNRYFCDVCYFDDNDYRSMESHVLVHNFLWESCQKETRNFDPEDYIQNNPQYNPISASPIKNFSCLDCNRSDFDTFRKFSAHRRSVHAIFHCDLCNKFYGRNSHLWKHVNRLHKNHPSITCQVCFKTSASKYHLAQHFARVHQTKIPIKNEPDPSVSDEFKEFTDPDNANTSCDENPNKHSSTQSDNDNSTDEKMVEANNDSLQLKCSKCSKNFHKSVLLKKHKQICRPKLQKDLLTRCKTCSRIFKDRQSLTKHLVNYHATYECEICLEKVPSKCEIVSHIRFQHPSSHLVCSVCGNVLRCKNDMLEHLLDHDSSFICQFCGDSLDSKVRLKMHILSLHRKILNLTCGICLKLFETQYSLHGHVTESHKNQLLPFTSCSVCGKNYGSKWKTYDHINKSHGRFFKVCKMCLEIFVGYPDLEHHLKMVHKVQLQIGLKHNNVKQEEDGLVVKKEEPVNEAQFESDSEENTEEIEEQSNSSESEAEDAELSKRQEVTFIDFPGQEDKITLLEKRLLGKSTTAEQKPSNGNTANTLNINPVSAHKFSVNISKKPKLKKTILSHHPKRTVYENSNDPSFCEICHKTWPAKKHLWQHYIRCHKRAAATVCGICLKTNNDYTELQEHLRDTHPTLLHGQGFGSNFICRICGRYHNASSKLRLHMIIHENFDWTLLERYPVLKSNEKSRKQQLKREPEVVSVKEEMYEDMIEQVEESTTASEGDLDQKTQESNFDSNSTTINPSQRQHAEEAVYNLLSFSNLLQTLQHHNQVQALTEMYCSNNEMSNVDNNSKDVENVRSQTVICSVHEQSEPPSLLKLDKAEENRNMSRPQFEKTNTINNPFSEHPKSQFDINRQHADINDPSQQNGNLNQTEIDSAVGSIL